MTAFALFGQVKGTSEWFLVDRICYSAEEVADTYHPHQQKYENCVVAEIADDTMKIVKSQQHAEYPFFIVNGVASYAMNNAICVEEIPFE